MKPSIPSKKLPGTINADNSRYYQQCKASSIITFAKSAGLESGADLDQLEPYLKHSKTILEVGGSYGRVIEHAHRINPTLKISAIEQVAHLADRLKQKYPFAKIIQGNILTHTSHEQYDLVTLLWSIIGEFSDFEKVLLIKKLAQLVTVQGRVVIDILDLNSYHPYGKTSNSYDYEIETEHGSVIYMLPTKERLFEIAQRCGLTCDEVITYDLNGITRQMLLFRKLYSKLPSSDSKASF